jgi:DNA-binding transcriptional MerR regulator
MIRGEIMKTNDERLNRILERLDAMVYIKPDTIPGIDLYMDQVTTFMDEHLKETKRYADDKVLTKTMINNYAKNNLLPAPNKKKYSKEHILLLIFIYYFKNLLSFNDIEELFRPITDKHFGNPDSIPLEEIYKEIFSLEANEMEHLKEDVKDKFQKASLSFEDYDLEDEDREYLQLFAWICQLSFDVYLKKQMIEQIIDDLRTDEPNKKKK